MKSRSTFLIIVFSFLVLPLPVRAVAPLPATIVDDAFTIGAGRFIAYPIAVHPRGGRVYGKFRAQGGGGNDIECYIMDEDGLENFGNGHSTRTFYNSGRVTVATINVLLREGRYFLVFNNKYSVFTPKAVTASIFIRLPNER